jgi:soluble lytic murein transglycosylase
MALLVARAGAIRKITPLILAFSLLAALPARAQEEEPVVEIPPAIELSREQVASEVTSWLRLQNDKTRGNFGDYARFLKEHPDWPQRSRLTRQAERSLTGRENDSTVIEFFTANAPQSVRGLDAYVKALREQDEHGVAQKAIKAFWRDIPLRVSEQKDVLSRYRSALDEADLHIRNDRIIMGTLDHPDDKTTGTQLANRRVLAGAIPLGEGHRAANSVRITITETIRKSNRGEVGTAQLRKIDGQIAAISAGDRGDTGFVYDHARWLEFTDRPEEAAQVLLKHPAHPHGDGSYVFRVRDMVARDLIEQRDVNTAYRVASEHGLSPNDAAYRDAEWLAGWIALRFLDNANNAREHFTKMYAQATSLYARSNGLYWLGRAELALGNKEEGEAKLKKAAREAGTMFYGQVAAADLYGEVTVGLPDPEEPSASVREAFNRKSLVKAAKLALNAGQAGLARDFIAAQANSIKSQAEAALTLDLANSTGKIDLAVFVAKRAGVQGFMTGAEGYPTVKTVPGCPETAFTFGLIRQETGFKDDAVSPAGALGRMQLMPKTAELQAKKLRIAHNKKMLISNPSHNMRLGCAYLSAQVDNFGGSYVLATAAYNAGPGRPVQWQERFGSLRNPTLPIRRQPGEPAYWATLDWIEAVPFEETRNYIKFVLGNANIYRAVLNENGKAKLRIAQDLTR